MTKHLRTPDADAPNEYNNLNELAATPQQRPTGRENDFDRGQEELLDEDVDAGVTGLDELTAPPPDENPEEGRLRFHRSLEDERDSSRRRSTIQEHSTRSSKRLPLRERLLVQLYTNSFLIFFSILGTLARLGVEWITKYPNAPVTTNVLWANLGGSLFLGFLQEDRALFAEQRGRALLHPPGSPSSGTDLEKEQHKVQAEHLAVKKTMPLYIGLSVGFCGSFTSYSTFMRDLFLALSADPLPTTTTTASRSAGWSVCAVLAVAIIEVAVSLSALAAGAHLSIALLPLTSKLPKTNSARFLNPLAVFLALGSWLGAIFLAIWPPEPRWRGDAVFALVFAPLGCILRYVLSMKLNPSIASFPLGTFSANILGTAVLGLAYDLQHAPLGSARGQIDGGLLGCQILAGVMDGFCGCLTTVSTWVAELRSLRRHHAYVYGVGSVGVAFSLLVVVIGGLHWTVGTRGPVCGS